MSSALIASTYLSAGMMPGMDMMDDMPMMGKDKKSSSDMNMPGMDMMEDIKGKKILDAFRGKPAVDREMLADILLAVGQIGLDHEKVHEIDINPLKLIDGKPVAVDALVVFE